MLKAFLHEAFVVGVILVLVFIAPWFLTMFFNEKMWWQFFAALALTVGLPIFVAKYEPKFARAPKRPVRQKEEEG